jgi:hypothetical protein
VTNDGTSTHIFLKTGLTVSGKRIIDYLHAIKHKAAIELFSSRSPFLRISSYAFMESSFKDEQFTPAISPGGRPTLKRFHTWINKRESNSVIQKYGSVHEYVHPHQVAPEMDTLVAFMNQPNEMHPLEKAAFVH